MFNYFLKPSFIIPVTVIILSWFTGLLVRKFLFKYVLKMVAKINDLWKFLIEPVKSYVSFWFLMAGIRISIPFTELSENTSGLITSAVIVLFIVTATFAVINIIANITQYYSNKTQTGLQSTTIFVNLTKIAVFVIGLLLIFQSLGIKITPLITALGVGGLAVALALQDTLSNLFAGLQIIFAGQVRLGDFVSLESGEKGEVVDITWRNSTIKTRAENMIVVPNSTLAQVIVTNYNLSGRYCLLRIPVGVSYNSDLEKVENITLKVAREVVKDFEGGDTNFDPRVRYNTFNDSSIDFNVVVRVKDYFDRFTLKHEFIKKLHRRYDKENINIPFPIRTIDYTPPEKK